MRCLSSWLLIFLCMVAAVPASAASAMPEPGMRIRVTARVPESQRWIGEFIANDRDTITLRQTETNGGLVTVPTLHVERFEISNGRHGNALLGAGIGFAMGAVFGAAIGYATSEEAYFDAGTNTAVGAVSFGVIGGVIGLVTGALTHSERWQALPLEDLRSGARP